MSEELIKRLRFMGDPANGSIDHRTIREAADTLEALSHPAPAVQVPEGMALVSRDEAISVLEGVANIVHVCWSEWGAAGSWSDYDQSVMEGMHALQAKIAAAPSPATVATEAVPHAYQYGTALMWPDDLSDEDKREALPLYAVATEAVAQECDGCKSQGRYAHSTQCRYAHFLAYSGLTGDSALRYAYFHGAHTDCEKPEAVAQGGGCNGTVNAKLLNPDAAEIGNQGKIK